MRSLDPEGHEVAPGQIGSSVVELLLPPGTLPALWNVEERFRSPHLAEYEGYDLTVSDMAISSNPLKAGSVAARL